MSVFRYQTLEAGQLQDLAKKKSFQETIKAGIAQNDERHRFTVQPSPEKERALPVIDRLLDFWWFNVTAVFRHIGTVLNQAVIQAQGSLVRYFEQLYSFFLAPPVTHTAD